MQTSTIQQSVISPPVEIAADDLYEVIDGIRTRLPPMGVFAVWIANQLALPLATFARAHNLGRAITEALFHMPAPIDCDRRPDVAFVSYKRWPKTRSIPRRSNAWDVVPDLAVEVVSPTDGAEELLAKILEYFRAGVLLVWVVYPAQSHIHIYHSPTRISVLTVADELDGGEVIPEFRLPLAELFTEPAENETETTSVT